MVYTPPYWAQVQGRMDFCGLNYTIHISPAGHSRSTINQAATLVHQPLAYETNDHSRTAKLSWLECPLKRTICVQSKNSAVSPSRPQRISILVNRAGSNSSPFPQPWLLCRLCLVWCTMVNRSVPCWTKNLGLVVSMYAQAEVPVVEFD